MSAEKRTRMQLFRATVRGEGQPEYVGLIEVPRAGFYWITGYVDRAKDGETFIRGELSGYNGPQIDLTRTPERADPAAQDAVVQPGFWPMASRKT